jgi:hypothetical protein
VIHFMSCIVNLMNMYNYFLKARVSLRSLSSLVINTITQVAIVLELALVLSHEEQAAVAAQLGLHSVHPRRRHGVPVAGRLQQGLELLDLGLEVAGVLLLAQAECALRAARCGSGRAASAVDVSGETSGRLVLATLLRSIAERKTYLELLCTQVRPGGPSRGGGGISAFVQHGDVCVEDH